MNSLLILRRDLPIGLLIIALATSTGTALAVQLISATPVTPSSSPVTPTDSAQSPTTNPPTTTVTPSSSPVTPTDTTQSSSDSTASPTETTVSPVTNALLGVVAGPFTDTTVSPVTNALLGVLAGPFTDTTVSPVTNALLGVLAGPFTDTTVSPVTNTLMGAVTVLNTPPTLDPIADMTVDELTLATFTASASDPDEGQTLTFSLSGAPDGANIDPSTGVFSWTPTEAEGPGVYTFDVIVSDGFAADSQSVTITVLEVGSAENTLAADKGIIGLGETTNLIQRLDTSSGLSGTLLSLNVQEPDGDLCGATGLPLTIPPSGELTFEYSTDFALVGAAIGDGVCDTMKVGVYVAQSQVDIGHGEVMLGTTEFQTNFFVIPESQIGVIALIASSLAALGVFALRRKHVSSHNRSLDDLGI